MRRTMDAKIAPADELLDALFDDSLSPLRAELGGWLRDSRRFRAFVTAQRSKIRAKLKSARDPAGLQDVRAELHTARLLLSDERFTLAYETYAAARRRGPDFTVTFKTHTPFNVEVRRLRPAELRGGDLAGEDAARSARPLTDKLQTVLCDKAGQMPPGIVNLLWLANEGELAAAEAARAVAEAALLLRRRADSKDEAFFTRHGFTSAAHFLRQYGQLSAVVLSTAGGQTVWPNPSARHKVLPEIGTAIGRLKAERD